jgi:hypothetical protein
LYKGRTGLGEFPVTSLSETELFKKFAVPQAEILVQGHYFNLRDIQTFSGVNLDLSGTEPAGRAQCDIFNQIKTTLIIRSLEFLLLLLQGKRRRKIKSAIQLVRSTFNCHVPIVPKFFFRWDLGMTVSYVVGCGVGGGFAATNPTSVKILYRSRHFDCREKSHIFNRTLLIFNKILVQYILLQIQGNLAVVAPVIEQQITTAAI